MASEPPRLTPCLPAPLAIGWLPQASGATVAAATVTAWESEVITWGRGGCVKKLSDSMLVPPSSATVADATTPFRAGTRVAWAAAASVGGGRPGSHVGKVAAPTTGSPVSTSIWKALHSSARDEERQRSKSAGSGCLPCSKQQAANSRKDHCAGIALSDRWNLIRVAFAFFYCTVSSCR